VNEGQIHGEPELVGNVVDLRPASPLPAAQGEAHAGNLAGRGSISPSSSAAHTPNHNTLVVSSSGRRLALADREPWPTPVDAAKLLDGIEAAIRRFVVLSKPQSAAVALWCVQAHAFEHLTITPRLAISSPVPRCGKSTLLDVVASTVPRPLATANISRAALYRTIEAVRPTVLADEADTFARGDAELLGILNSGHRRGGQVIRTVPAPGGPVPRAFSTWSPLALGYIGRSPGTLEDRSVIIELRRRKREEEVRRWRADRSPAEFEPLARKAARCARDMGPVLAQADPEIPPDLHDRAADNWRPLLAIADVAGGGWPERAREAAVLLSARTNDEAGGERLLADVRQVFLEAGDPEWLPSGELVEGLQQLPDAPWADGGRRLSERRLAAILRPFGIRTERLGGREDRRRGYRRANFADAWDRYLPALA
jgi:putative DNA primase/helicase